MHLVPSTDPVLLSKAERVEFPHPGLARTVGEMLEIMITNQGCGLAAPQVGLPLRIIMYRYEGKFATLINPEIVYRNSEIIESDEGCLSFIGEMYRTKRAKDIVISYQEITGKIVQNVKVVEFPAIILQHECLWGRTQVLTEDGLRIISDLVDSRYRGKVLSLNPQTMNVEFKPVIGWSKKRNTEKKQWISLRTDTKTNNLICTMDHHCAFLDDIFNPSDISFYPARDALGKYLVTLPRKDREKNKTHCLFGKKQISVILGCLMGDGSITSRGDFRFTHGEAQFEYASYKAKLCKMSDPYYHNAGFTTSKKVSYYSLVNEQLKLLRRMSYQWGRKKTVMNLLELLDETSLAFWYMDDGCLVKRSGKNKDTLSITIHTEGFSEEDNDAMVTWFSKRWDIEVRKAKRSSGKVYLRLGDEAARKLLSIITPHAHSSMSYKFLQRPSDEPFELDEIFISCRHIREIAVVQKESCLYDLTVEDNHNLFANYNLVHNCDHLDGIVLPQHGVKKIREC